MNKQPRSFLILTVALIAGLLVYQVAPPDVAPGTYDVTLSIESSGLNMNYSFQIEMIQSGAGERVDVSLFGSATNVTVTYTDRILIATSSQISVVVSAVGQPLSVAQITLVITGPNGFNVLLRSTRQSGQSFTIDYQPPVRSQAALAILVAIAILWFTEGVSLVAASILIPVLIVVLNVQTPTTTLAAFFDPAVALILGGFMIARAIDKYELDRRLALLILSKSTGSGSRLLLVIMSTTAFLSLWISNTAAAAIMIPIALALIDRIRSEDIRNKFGKAIVLAVAYSATLGGIGTLVGSPPNPLAAAYAKSFLGVEISFVTWLPFGMPILLILIPVVWQWLIRRFKLPTDIQEIRDLKELSKEEYLKLGPLALQEKTVIAVFAGVVFLWLTEKLPDLAAGVLGWSGHGIPSSIVALMGGFALFVCGLFDEKDMKEGIAWPSLLILGSGIALGESMIVTGLSASIAQQMQGLGALPGALVLVLIGVAAVMITMVASNTGAAVILIPISVPLATGLGINPLLVIMVIAICVSMDFALPTGTPPSTIAYSTGKVSLREMISTGLVLDFIAILAVTIIGVYLWTAIGIIAVQP